MAVPLQSSLESPKYPRHYNFGFNFVEIMFSLIKCYYDGFLWRSRLEKAKKEQEDRLEYVKEQLEICSHDAKRRIKEITSIVEGQVSS